MTWLFLILRNWRWVAGALVTLVLVGTVGFLKVELAVARSSTSRAQAELQAMKLDAAKAVSEAKKQSLETQDRAAVLVQQSAKSFDEKLAEIRSFYRKKGAVRPGPSVGHSGQPGGVRSPDASGSVPEAAPAPGQPDAGAPDHGVAPAPLDERCAETTQQLLDLQEYVRGLQRLYNAR